MLSIPIGIATGLAVNPIQKWFENRGKTKAAVKLKDVKDRYEIVLFYRLHPHLFTQYLLHTVIRTTFVGAAAGILLGILHAIPNAFFLAIPALARGEPNATQMALFLGLPTFAQLTTVVSSVLIIRYCRPAIQLWHQVRTFEKFVDSVPSEHRNLAAEREAKEI